LILATYALLFDFARDLRCHSVANGTGRATGGKFYHLAARPRKIDGDGSQIGFPEGVRPEVRVTAEWS
jgi:hypothetical protein